jgi:hypothetical protein
MAWLFSKKARAHKYGDESAEHMPAAKAHTKAANAAFNQADCLIKVERRLSRLYSASLDHTYTPISEGRLAHLDFVYLEENFLVDGEIGQAVLKDERGWALEGWVEAWREA